ncbi:MAG: hypothetical protein Kow0042_14630 [Calditrichia bacterium]
MFATIPNRWKFILITCTAATLFGILTYFFFPKYTELVLLFFYIIPSNSFIPFPHEPAIIYYGKIYGPLLTTLTALIPTIIACIIDYAVLTPIFTRTRLAKIKDTRLFRRTTHYYRKAPFLTNLIAAFSPVPFYPVRILSVASDYPLWKYTTAVVTGRLPRYYLLSLSGALLNIPNWVVTLFFISLVCGALYSKISSKSPEPVLPTAEDMILEPPLSGIKKAVPSPVTQE